MNIITFIPNNNFKINIIDVNTNKKWNDFYKPVKISSKLKDFFEINCNNQPKTIIEITNLLCSYIRKNDLISEKNKRIIEPDNNLKLLFNIKKNDLITFLNLQKFILPHIKN
jgi:chromatin remodeling complex protein RSC6